MKVDQVKERFVKANTEAIEKLNQEMAQAMTDFRAAKDAELGQKLADLRRTHQAKADKARSRIDDQYREERNRLMASLEQLENVLKDNLSKEQLELERRVKKKQYLLAMLAMEDATK